MGCLPSSITQQRNDIKKQHQQNKQQQLQQEQQNQQLQNIDVDAKMGEMLERLKIKILSKYDKIILKRQIQIVQIALQIQIKREHLLENNNSIHTLKFANNVKLTIEQIDKYPIVYIYKQKQFWNRINQNEYEFYLNDLREVDQEIIIFEIQIPKLNHKNVKSDQVLNVLISGSIVQFNKPFIKEHQLILNFTNDQFFKQQKNEFVEVAYLDAKANDLMQKIDKEQINYEQSQVQIRKMINEIAESEFFYNLKLGYLLNKLKNFKFIQKEQNYEKKI